MTVAPHLRPTSPAALLAAYRAGDAFYFTSPTGGLLAARPGPPVTAPRSPGRRSRPTGNGAAGGHTAIHTAGDHTAGDHTVGEHTAGSRTAGDHAAGGHTVGDLAAVADAVDAAQAAAGRDGSLVVGAVPFTPEAGARLTMPDRVRRSGPLPAVLPAPAAGPVAALRARRELPSGAAYADGVRAAVARMAGGELSKVVLARAVEVTAAAPVDTPLLLRRLAARDPGGYLFAVDVGDGSTLVGSSPELLVSRRGATVVANPLAGSVPRAADPVEDTRRAQALLASRKDLHEHAVVVDAVRQALAALCVELEVPAAPSLVRTAAMWHLSTTVRARLADPGVSSLRLAAALHPTPAVCGTPPHAARAVIGAHEPVDRGWFAGLTGWQDGRGDGEWAVTLRCAVVRGDVVRLYAGAGVVAASDPDAELAETEAKLRTVLTGLGL